MAKAKANKPATKPAPKQEIKQLSKAVNSGTATARQQTRLNFLNKQQAASAGGNKASSGGGKNTAGVPGLKLPKNQRQAFQNEQAVANYEQERNIQANNPNVQGTFGGQTVTYDPETGQPTVTQSLSPEMQKIYEAGSGLTSLGQSLAQQNLQGYKPMQQGSDDFRNKAFDTAYSYFTKNMDRDMGQDKQSLEQSLNDRGIPFSNDPNSRYQQEMSAFNDKWANAKQDASSRAFLESGQEATRNYGMDLQTHQQGMLDTAQLGNNTGIGLQVPNLPQFQGAQYDQMGPTEIAAAMDQMKTNALQRKIAQKQYDRMGNSTGGGGGGNSGYDPNAAAYSTQPYPGT